MYINEHNFVACDFHYENDASKFYQVRDVVLMNI